MRRNLLPTAVVGEVRAELDLTDEELDDINFDWEPIGVEAVARFQALTEVEKAFGQPNGRRKNKARQIRNLKRKRKYKKPVRGGRRKPTFAKTDHPLVKHAGPGNHPSGSGQDVHGGSGGRPVVWKPPSETSSWESADVLDIDEALLRSTITDKLEIVPGSLKVNARSRSPETGFTTGESFEFQARAKGKEYFFDVKRSNVNGDLAPGSGTATVSYNRYPSYNDRIAGSMLWGINRPNVITTVTVPIPEQRRGIATAMLQAARLIDPDLKHSTDLSEKGRAWADVVKHAGPGDHPSGSSQDVHGGGAGRLGPNPKIDDSVYQRVNELRDAGKTDEAMALFDSKMEIDRKWKSDARYAMSVGAVTFDEAKALGYRTVGHDNDGWEALPETLYHVTTAKSAVVADGLKSRDELAQSRGKGLGGGESDTISFTEEKHIADSIYTAMLEAQKVATGDKTVLDMIAEAKEVGSYDKMMGMWNWEGKPGLPPGVQDLIDGVKQRRWSGSGFPKGVHFVTPDTVEEHLGAGSFVRPEDERNGKWMTAYSPRTFEDQQEHVFDFYKTFAAYREYAGGPMNPLFFSTDVAGLAAIPSGEIAIIKVKANPGAQGYKVSALGEWRTASGDAVTVEAVNP